MSERERAAAAGLVFQFPERHFLGDSILAELTFGWPADFGARRRLSERLVRVRGSFAANVCRRGSAPVASSQSDDTPGTSNLGELRIQSSTST